MTNIKALTELTKYCTENNVDLVAVSKTKSVGDILTAYNHGQKAFGENKVQELVSKYEALPKDIQWHMIGNLQSNKVKYIAPFVHLIHSVDSLKLALEINKQAEKNNRVIDVLLEVHIAAETNKIGFSEEELMALLEINAFDALKNINIIGVMGMATYTQSKVLIKNEFNHLKYIFDELKANYFTNDDFKIISMGMSGDYEIAVACGSNMIRIGSTIFGERERKKNSSVPI
ncbi:MAG: YggS family pyridoxal phosphate-dependent enzyme [Chitinophagales bacterium]|nr:YggS family pyridoxal phosphate-dependent enzyme [Chitinophagales bacterium]